MSSGRYMAYSPSPSASHSPHIGAAGGSGGVMRAAASVLMEQEKYLSELLSERIKIIPFVAVLPNSYRLLNQAEILRVTKLLENASILEHNGFEQASPMASAGIYTNGGANNRRPSPFQSEVTSLMQPSSTNNWLGSHGSPSGLIVKRLVRIDVPVEQYPNYNFVGRLLGPRGNSLKRVEAATGCRVLIRGRGSVKDPEMEAAVRGKPGYEHLSEPLHVLIEAEMPVEIIDARVGQAREIIEDLLKPMDESQDYYKQQQLRELALLNGSVSPFNSSLGMKRAKIGG
ncbi:KH domain-containing protein [Striga hermonthica]|uniref:KH domain-containing protein n=1 Tax=Striga hermonthica TaxID=68872 RepID=A0A9N7NR12_STRHE|nr:KH domain-containing protein [Striga hermonthica]